MKNLLSIITIALLPVSLFAQSKPTPRKATATSSRLAVSRPVTKSAPTRQAAPAKKPTPAPVAATTSPAPQQVAQNPQPQADTPVTPKSQPVAASRPAQPSAPVASKASETSRFRVGFRLGANSSTIGGVDPLSVGEGITLARVIGFHGGVVMNIGGPSFSVQPEILYTQYGVRMALGSDYLQLKYNIVEVPVLLKASFGQPNLRFFVNAGPVLTYTLGGEVSVHEGGQSESQAIDMTNEGRLSYGASGGAGVTLKTGPGSFLLEARYSYLFSSNEGGTKLNPQNAMISVGYLFPLGGR